MDFRLFLALADSLSQGTSEAEWRTAVSRAYYAAFHLASERLEAMGFRVPRRTEQSHIFVSRRLSNSAELAVDRTGGQLNALRGDRNRADYDKNVKVSAKDARDAVIDARAIIAILDQLGRDSNLAEQIADAIKKYERDVLKEVTWRK